MPLYEYACAACGAREERLESLAAPRTHDCPTCGRPAGMHRQLSAAAVTVAGATVAAGPSCATGTCPFARG